jgi:hypothetical protein
MTGRRLAALVAALTLGEACGDSHPSDARVQAGFEVISSPARTDTALAIPRPLVVQLHNASGKPQANEAVTIRAVKHDSISTMYFDSTTRYAVDVVTRTTDADGKFSIDARFGRTAGSAGIILSALSAPVPDTIAFTILPAAPAQISITPHDTAVLLNHDVVVTITVKDRSGNARQDVPTLQTGSGIRSQGDGRVTGLAYGRATLTARISSLSDVAFITVVPPGRLAGLQGASVFYVWVVNTDGSSAKPFLTQVGWPNGAARRSANGQHVLVSEGSQRPGPFRLVEVATNDGSQRAVWLPSQGTNQGWPDYSTDGQWIYFVLAVGPYDYGQGTGAIWRVHLDGTGAEQVVAAPPSGLGWMSPSLSPKGDVLAYIGGDGSVIVRPLGGAGPQTIQGLAARTVRWSPSGDQLLVAGESGLYVLKADGTARRQLRTPPIAVGRDAAWSPDGAWIVWEGTSGVELIQLDTGVGVVLPFFREPTFEGGWGFAWMNQP